MASVGARPPAVNGAGAQRSPAPAIETARRARARADKVCNDRLDAVDKVILLLVGRRAWRPEPADQKGVMWFTLVGGIQQRSDLPALCRARSRLDRAGRIAGCALSVARRRAEGHDLPARRAAPTYRPARRRDVCDESRGAVARSLTVAEYGHIEGTRSRNRQGTGSGRSNVLPCRDGCRRGPCAREARGDAAHRFHRSCRRHPVSTSALVGPGDAGAGGRASQSECRHRHAAPGAGPRAGPDQRAGYVWAPGYYRWDSGRHGLEHGLLDARARVGITATVLTAGITVPVAWYHVAGRWVTTPACWRPRPLRAPRRPRGMGDHATVAAFPTAMTADRIAPIASRTPAKRQYGKAGRAQGAAL